MAAAEAYDGTANRHLIYVLARMLSPGKILRIAQVILMFFLLYFFSPI